MPTAALVSYRLGGADGVSVEAAKWTWALSQLGFAVYTVGGAGPVDHLVPGLGLEATEPPRQADLEPALTKADLVIATNICSLPLNPAAGHAVAAACRGRPSVMHHHDLPWQRPQFRRYPAPPDDPSWRHVTINDLSRRELAERGIKAAVIHNTFDPEPRHGRGDALRQELGVEPGAKLLLQPTRGLYRKNVPGGITLAERLDATYWLLGPAEDGYGPQLKRIVAQARCPVIHRWGHLAGTTFALADAYAASDLVVLPSIWEGFGNPAIESAMHRLPLAIGPYPVARELAAYGFRWFPLQRAADVAGWLRAPDLGLLPHNLDVARRHFSLHDLPHRLARLVDGLMG